MALTATSGSPTVTVGVTSPKLRATISIELLQASVSAARTTTSVTYELSHATGIWTDPDSKNRMLKDEFPLSDVRFSLVEKNLSETLTFTDVIGVAMLWVRGFTDTFKVYDENPNALNVNLLNSQAMNAQDTSFLVDRGLDKGDALGFSEITAFVHSKGLTDSAILADTNAILVSKPKTDSFGVSDDSYVSSGVNPSDSISFGDSYERVLSKVLSDAFALDDAALINKNYSGNKGNIFGVSDVFDRSVMYARSFQETVSTSDTNKVIFTAGKSDSVSISDILEFNTEYNRNFTDTAVLDSVSLLALGKAFTDTINSVTDVYAITQMKNPSDTIDFTDSTRATIEKDVIDGIGLDDSTLVNKNYFGNKGNLIGLSELVSLVTTYKRTISDSVALSETLDTAFNKNETENITLNELTGVTSSKTLGENFTFNDGYGLQLAKHVTDAFTLDDAALVDKNYIGNKGNIMSLSDLVEVNLIRSNQLGTRNLNTMPFN